MPKSDWQHAGIRIEIIAVDPAIFAALPLISGEICEELFAAEEDPDVTLMQREIWREIRTGLLDEVRGLPGLDDPELCSQLHRIRGGVSTASLLRLGAILKAWEDDPRLGADYLPLALATCSDSISTIEERYPHLVSGPNPG